MFIYTLSHWLTFLSVVLLLNLCPGPDMALILSHTVQGGRKSGFIAMFGMRAGAFLQVLMAALGITTILTRSALVFSIFKWIGAAYLVIIGIQMLIQKNEIFEVDDQEDNAYSAETLAIFRQGFMSNILNPKAAIFMIAFLPQFAVSNVIPIWLQVLLHGILQIFVSACIMGSLILFSASLYESVLHTQELKMVSNKIFGLLLIILGVTFRLL